MSEHKSISNEVLLEKIENLHSTAMETLSQVKTTNGRVKALEIQDAVNKERYKLYSKFLYSLLTMVVAIGSWLIVDYFIAQKNLINIIDERIQANNNKYFETIK